MTCTGQEPRSFTDVGLPGIKYVPYGVHMCHFYATRAELVAALVPYFAAGLRNGERCIWITAHPLESSEAQHELAQRGVDSEAALRDGSLVVHDYSRWYADGDRMNASDIVGMWLAEEKRAVESGYAGLRIAGNPSFVSESNWQRFMDYEALFHDASQGRRIVSLCNYRLGSGGAAGALDVVMRHTCTLDRPDEGWQILTR